MSPSVPPEPYRDTPPARQPIHRPATCHDGVPSSAIVRT